MTCIMNCDELCNAITNSVINYKKSCEQINKNAQNEIKIFYDDLENIEKDFMTKYNGKKCANGLSAPSLDSDGQNIMLMTSMIKTRLDGYVNLIKNNS